MRRALMGSGAGTHNELKVVSSQENCPPDQIGQSGFFCV